jgi:hypothetical protein
VSARIRLSPQGWQALAHPPATSEFRLVYPEVARGLVERRDELVSRVLDSDVSGF